MILIPRKLTAIAAAAIVPLALIAALADRVQFLKAGALAWAALGIAALWLYSRSLSRRIRGLTTLSGHIADFRLPQSTPKTDDDELGDLARGLSRIPPKMQEALNGLSTELARREAILASLSEPVLAVDSKLQVSFCNSAFRRIVQAETVPEGVPLLKVLRHPALIEALRKVIDSGETVRQRLNMAAVRDGMTFEMYATALANNASRGALVILQDISPLERLERTKRDFVANVSHEFRTPLATITGYAETLLNGGLEDEENRRRFVEVIQANGVRLNNIAADLITLSELEVGRPAGDPTPILISEVIERALHTIEPLARLNNVRLHVNGSGGLEVLGYRIRFEQVLVNLLDNAIKFNKSGGEVRVSTAAGLNNTVEISVADSGIGIPNEDLSRIFERFYRVDKARSRQVGGTGLGLSIVRHAVEQMQGTITVTSEPGRGSCFTVSLPLHRLQTAEKSTDFNRTAT